MDMAVTGYDGTSPRCGGNASRNRLMISSAGTSPRVWGKLHRAQIAVVGGNIPTRVGKTLPANTLNLRWSSQRHRPGQ